MSDCPVCHKPLDQDVEACQTCNKDHHPACLSEDGVCKSCRLVPPPKTRRRSKITPESEEASEAEPSGEASEASTPGPEAVGDFECNICNQTFARRHNLNQHMKSHADGGNKAFRCKACGASFQRKHDLKRHERRHTNARPFTCSVCDKSFSRADALHRHERSIHKSGAGGQTQPKPKPTRTPAKKRKRTVSSSPKSASPRDDAEAVAVLSDMLRTRASSLGPQERGQSPMEKRFKPLFKSGLGRGRLDTDDDYRYSQTGTGDSDYDDDDDDIEERKPPVENYYETYPEPTDRIPTIPYTVPAAYTNLVKTETGVYSDHHLSSAEDDIFNDQDTQAAVEVLSSKLSPAFPATLRQQTMSPIIESHIPSHPPRPSSGQRARTRSVEAGPISPSTFAFGHDHSLAQSMGIHSFRAYHRLDTASPVPLGSPAVDVGQDQFDPPDFTLQGPINVSSPLLTGSQGLRIPRAATPTGRSMASPSPLRAAVANSMAQAQRTSSSTQVGEHVRLSSSEQDVTQSPLMGLAVAIEEHRRQSPAPQLPPPVEVDEKIQEASPHMGHYTYPYPYPNYPPPPGYSPGFFGFPPQGTPPFPSASPYPHHPTPPQ